MEPANDFFTLQSLLTFGGATTATIMVPNALQMALKRNFAWLGLLVAWVVCLLVVFQAHQSAGPGVATPWTDYLVAVVNGCLVFCSAAGATSVGNAALQQEGKMVPKSV